MFSSTILYSTNTELEACEPRFAKWAPTRFASSLLSFWKYEYYTAHDFIIIVCTCKQVRKLDADCIRQE